MSFVQKEINRIQNKLKTVIDTPTNDRLFAAQRSLLWSLDPNAVQSPYDMIMGMAANSEDCSDECRPPQS